MMNTFLRNIEATLQDLTISEQENVIEVQDKIIKDLEKSSKKNALLTDFEQKLGSFVVKIDNVHAAESILNFAEQLGFSIDAGRRTIEGDGTSLLSIFFEENTDIKLISDWKVGALRNLRPVLSASNDYYTIKERLVTAASRRDSLILNRQDKGKTYRSLALLKSAELQRVLNNPMIDAFSKATKAPKKEVTDVYVEDCGLFIQVTKYINNKLVSSEVIAKNNLRDYVSEIVIIES